MWSFLLHGTMVDFRNLKKEKYLKRKKVSEIGLIMTIIAFQTNTRMKILAKNVVRVGAKLGYYPEFEIHRLLKRIND